MSEVQAAFPKPKVPDGQRVRFEISGGSFRLIASFTFRASAVYIKFLGTHADYDDIDPCTVSEF